MERLRVCAGPHDPEIGKHIRPQSLRARFGSNRVENALHVTDLAEDGVLEVKLIFKIIQKILYFVILIFSCECCVYI